jgi:hypothetical protein
MFSSSSIIQIIFIFLVTISIAYIFGFIINNMMERKLQNITNQMPYQMERFLEKFENKNNQLPKEKIELVKTLVLDSEDNEDGVRVYKDITNNKELIGQFDNEYYENMDYKNKVNGFDSGYEPQKNIDWSASNNIQQACFKNHVHNKANKNSECFYGTTNYADPHDMSPIDYKVYMMNYPPNFTLQDYVNWLWCYQNKKDKLPYNHLRNLEKLELGKELKAEPGVLPPPGYYFPPMNAEDYFNTLYNDQNEFNLAENLNSTTASMLGYNYNDYSEFSQNRDVYGVSGDLRNPDIGLKKTANEVDTYIIPHDSQNLEIEHKYKPYRVKKIEI